MKKKELMVRLEHIFESMNPKIEGAKFASVSGALDAIETCAVYVDFDLWATRRERDEARKK